MELKDCFIGPFSWRNKTQVSGSPSPEGFTEWLLKISNNPKVQQAYLGELDSDKEWEDRLNDMLDQVVKESLKQILDILLIEPTADYFWYEGGYLYYSVPSNRTFQKFVQNGYYLQFGEAGSIDAIEGVPSNAIRVNKEKMKIFLRDYKLQTLLK